MLDLAKLMAEMADSMFEDIEQRLQSELRKRDDTIAELRAQIAAIPAGKDGVAGRDGVDGKDGRDGIDGKDGARGATGENGADGRDGIDGRSVSVEDIEPLIARMVSRSVEALPKARDGTDGRDGRDGASVPVEAVATLVNAEVAKAVAALPKPADGKDGRPGEPGKDGRDGVPGKDGERGVDGKDGAAGRDGAAGLDGKDGAPGKDGRDGETPIIDLHEVAEIIKSDPEMVTLLRGERGAEGLRGRDGEPGKDGMPGRDGADGQPGRDGTPGRDGADGKSVTVEQVREVVENRFNGWALEFEREAGRRQLEAINAIPLPRDGRDGERGRDGFGMDDFEWRADTPDGGRTLLLELSAGGRVQTVRLKTSTVIDRGTFDAQKRYEAGDAITYGGHLWIVQKDGAQGKPGESPDFRLAVRRGRDSKE